MRIDLHAHSTASDGTEPPAEVARRAAEAGLDIVALTDHDTTAGWAEAYAEGRRLGVEVALGCEVSCLHLGISVHLLAYRFDPEEPAFAAERESLRTDRERRAARMVELLQGLGLPVTRERVFELAGGGAIGRPHVARALVEAGVVPDVASAFSADLIGQGGRAYVEKRALDPVDAVRLVAGAGGVSVLAHPAAARRGAVLGEDVVAAMADAGLAGLEVDHPDHTDEARSTLRELAARLSLLCTGSSDDHGALTGHRLGVNLTSPEIWEEIVTRSA